jgi:CTP:molybdopterin cytidylyltransferase MocA
MDPRDTGAVILAAGRSERMKELKAFLPDNEKVTFIEKILSTYSDWGCSEIIMVTNKKAFDRMNNRGIIPSDVKMVINDHLEFERFYSVKIGLGALHTSSFCFIQNVDNPFIDTQILDILYEHRSNEKYVSPVFENKGGHPVLLNRQNINQIYNWPGDTDILKDVLNTMECRMVEMPDDRVLININNLKDYKRFFNVIPDGINL